MLSEKFADYTQKKLVDLTEQGPITQAVAYHDAGDEGVQERLDTFVVVDGVDPRAFAESIWLRCEDDCQSRARGMQQRYEIHFFRPGLEERDSAYGFLLRGRGPAREGPHGDSEPANERGVLAITSRALSEANRQLHVQSESVAGVLAQELSEERRLRKSLEANQRAITLEQNALLDTRAERELALQKEARRAVRDEKLLEGVSGLVMLVAAEFLKSRGLDVAKTHTRDGAVGSFLQSLDVDQLEKIAQHLRPDQNQFLIELYRQHRSEHVEKEAEVDRHTVKDPPKPSPTI